MPRAQEACSRVRAFSGKVDTGFPQKCDQTNESRARSDSTQSESALAHDLEKPAPDSIRGGRRFSEKITLEQKARARF
jgi:hypothetical protein